MATCLFFYFVWLCKVSERLNTIYIGHFTRVPPLMFFCFCNLPKIQRGDPCKMSKINVVQSFWNFAQSNKIKKISKEPKFEVSNSKNKDLAQQCNLQKVWKILLSHKTWEKPKNMALHSTLGLSFISLDSDFTALFSDLTSLFSDLSI